MKKIISLSLAIVMVLLSAVAAGAAFDPYAQNGYDKVIYTQDFEGTNDFTTTGTGAVVQEGENDVYSLSRTDTSNKRAGAPVLNISGVKYLKAEMKIKLNKLPNKDGVAQIATYGNSSRRPIAEFSKDGKIYLAGVDERCEYSAGEWVTFVFYIDYVKGLCTSYVDGKLLASQVAINGLRTDGFGQIVGVLFTDASSDMIMYFDDIKYSVPSGSIITSTTTTTQEELFYEDFSEYTDVTVGTELTTDIVGNKFTLGAKGTIRQLANDPEENGTRGYVLKFTSPKNQSNKNQILTKSNSEADSHNELMISFEFYPTANRLSWVYLYETSSNSKPYVELSSDGSVKVRDKDGNWNAMTSKYNVNQWNKIDIRIAKDSSANTFALTVKLNDLETITYKSCSVWAKKDVKQFAIIDRETTDEYIYLDNIFFGYETTSTTTSSYGSYVIRQSDDSALISTSYTANENQTVLPIVAAYDNEEDKNMTSVSICEGLSATAENSPLWFDAYIKDGNAGLYKVFFLDGLSMLVPLTTPQEF